jgi:lipopolysaccharide-binding protein
MYLRALRLFSLIFVLYVQQLQVVSANPGALATMSQNGIEEIKSIALPIIMQQLQHLTVPNIQTQIDTIIGSITMWVTNIAIRGIQFDMDVRIAPNQGITGSVTNLACMVNCLWAYRKDAWPHVSDHGSADVSVSSTSVIVTVDIGDNNGHPFVITGADNVNIGDFSLTLHGGASWLYNVFIWLFKNVIKARVESAIHDAIMKAINQQAETFIQNFPIVQKINDDVEVDFSLTSAPLFTPNYFTVPLKGEILAVNKPIEYPISPPVVPPQPVPQMLQVILTDYPFASAAFAYYTTGKLHFTLNNNNLPPNFPVKLNTNDWQFLLPGLYKAYPNTPMQLDIFAAQPPSVSIGQSGMNVTTVSNLVISVTKGPQVIPCITIAVVVAASATVHLNSTTLIPVVSYGGSNLSLKNSTVGPVDLSVLNGLINLVLQNIVFPLANNVLQTGIPLPVVQGTSLVNPSITFGPHYVLVNSDFKHSALFMQRRTSLFNFAVLQTSQKYSMEMRG